MAFYYWRPEFITVAELNQYLKAKRNKRKFLQMKSLRRYKICHYRLDKSLSWRLAQNDRYLFPTQSCWPLVLEGAFNSLYLNHYHTGCHFAWKRESVKIRLLTPPDKHSFLQGSAVNTLITSTCLSIFV